MKKIVSQQNDKAPVPYTPNTVWQFHKIYFELFNYFYWKTNLENPLIFVVSNIIRTIQPNSFRRLLRDEGIEGDRMIRLDKINLLRNKSRLLLYNNPLRNSSLAICCTRHISLLNTSLQYSTWNRKHSWIAPRHIKHSWITPWHMCT